MMCGSHLHHRGWVSLGYLLYVRTRSCLWLIVQIWAGTLVEEGCLMLMNRDWNALQELLKEVTILPGVDEVCKVF
jgi:hypothetical protein